MGGRAEDALLNYELVVFLNSDFAALEGHRTRWREVLVSWAARTDVGRVIVIDPPSFRPRRVLSPEAFGFPRRPSWVKGVEVLGGAVAAPPTSSISSLAWRRAGGVLARRIGPPAPGSSRIVVSANPLWNPVVRWCRAQRTLFDAVDDWTSWDWAVPHRRAIERGYREAAQFDAASCVSTSLQSRLREFGLPCIVVENGIDAEAFRRPRPRPTPVADLDNYAIYAGSVQSRVDLAALRGITAAGRRVVVAGPADEEIAAQLHRSEVRWLGPVAPDDLVALYQHAAVGLVPHLPSPFTASMDPMKLHEYRAAGIPVVTTVAPPATSHGDPWVFHEPSRDKFVRRVVTLVDGGRSLGVTASVTRRSWEQVAERLLRLAVTPRPAS